MQVSACSDTAQPFDERDPEQLEPRAPAAVAARVEIEEADALGGDLEVAADMARDAAAPAGGAAARRTRASARDDARAWRKYSPISASTRCCDCRPSQPNVSATFSCSSWVSTLTSRPALEVQDRAHAQQEILGVLQLTRGAIVLGVGCRAGFEQPDVPRRDDVAQPAGRALDVRLELIDACR